MTLIDRIVAGEVELLSVSDICATLKVTRSELLRWTRNKRTSSIQFPKPDIMIGGKRRWDKSTLTSWMEADSPNGWSAVKGKYFPRFE